MLDNILKKYSDYMDSSFSLIPSENIIPESILQSIPSELYNRYYFDSVKWIELFPWSEYLREIIINVENTIKKQLKVDYVDIKWISWVNLMTIVISWLLKTWEGIYIVPSNKWGHNITKQIALKFWFKTYDIPFLEDWNIDQIKMIEDSNKFDIKLVYIDQMSWNNSYNFNILKSSLWNNIITYYDVSHNLAYYFSSYKESLLKSWFDAFWWSTHKTFPWWHKAIFCTNSIDLFLLIEKNSKIFVSHIHMYDLVILWKVLEYMNNKWDNYILKINKINKLMRKLFEKLWFSILEFNPELNHQLLLYNDSIDLAELNKKFSNNWIILNYLWIDKKPVLRLWFQEFAMFNPSDEDIKEILKYISLIFLNKNIDRNSLKILKTNLKNNV